jgi:hypothetical protein
MTKTRSLIAVALLSSCLALPLSGGAFAMQEQNDEQPPLDDFSDVQRELEGQASASDDDEAVSEAPAEQENEAEPDADADSIVARSEQGLARIAKVIERVDEDATRDGNNWQLSIDDTQILVITDVNAGRMRIMTPISTVEDLPEGALLRLLQANFDSALDARYAVAQDLVWGTFIHPLPSLTERDFASGLLQTKTVSDTFGTTFSSGAITFGGGDSNAIISDQLEELLKELEKENAI